MEKQCGEYEALQMQRAKEREIRAIKREIAGYQGVMLGTDDENLLNEAQNKFDLSSHKLKSKEEELQDFVEQTGLKRNNERERVAGFNKGISQKAIYSSNKLEKSQETLYNSSIGLGTSLKFLDNTDRYTFIPKGTEITNITTIAGENAKTFRNANKYVDLYGGNLSDWSKKVGKIESAKYIFDIHWVQGKNGILCEWKIKSKTLKKEG